MLPGSSGSRFRATTRRRRPASGAPTPRASRRLNPREPPPPKSSRACVPKEKRNSWSWTRSLPGYARVNAALQQQDFAEAQKGLDSLRAYLDDPSVASLPTVQKRRAVEMFLIDSLGDLVRSRRSPASTGAAVVSEADAQLRNVSDLVAKGDALSKRPVDLGGARDSYLQAIRVVPSVNRGYLALDEMRAAEDQQGPQAAIAGLQESEPLLPGRQLPQLPLPVPASRGPASQGSGAGQPSSRTT